MDIDATYHISRRIDVNTTSFLRHVPAGNTVRNSPTEILHCEMNMEIQLECVAGEMDKTTINKGRV